MQLALRKVVKKTFNIEENNVQKMTKLIPARKQSEFVDLAIREKLQKTEDEIILAKLKHKIKNIKRVKPIISSVDAVRKIREEN